MSADAFADVEREPLVGPDGRPVLHFLRGTRDGLPSADLVVAAPGTTDEEVAVAALDALPGWAFSGSVAVGRLLLARGATTIRHAHVMRYDLRSPAVDPAWATAGPQNAHLQVVPPPTDPKAYLELIEAAYPTGHPDFVARSEADRIATDVLPLLDGTLGPVLDGSSVVVERADGAGDDRMVAACIVTDMDTNGPWVVDVSRCPGAAYAGLGALLLRRAIAVLAGQGRPALGLAVTEGNPARHVYARLGFVDVLESLTVRLPDRDPSA